MKLALDPARSSVRVHTFAEGLFSRLAHDLELTCRGVSGASSSADSATLEAPIDRIEVSGTRKGGRLDPSGLSSSERADILEKMRKDVFHTKGGSVRIEATRREEGSARVRVIVPGGKSAERTAAVQITSGTDEVRVVGSLELSLAALGSDPVKGPMNAFRVKDGVEIYFDVVFVRAPS